MLKRATVIAVLAVLLSMVQVPANAVVTPRPGPTFNSAVGDGAAQRAIVRKIVRTINAVPRRERIQIMTWNFQSPEAVKALVRAQRRGVKVELLMARGNRTRIDNVSFERLQTRLERGNRGRAAERRSFARTCFKSCRGRGGAAHAKFFLFSQAGRARNVTIHGSANLTAAAANNQWNDVVTTVNRSGPYRFLQRVFDQMKRDRPLRRPYAQWRGGPDRLVFLPAAGGPDPVMRLLRQVKCRRATNTRAGRTVIRIVPDAMREERGMRLGRKIRSLWQDGCDVKLGYTVMGRDVGRMLRSPGRRGPVPLRHLVQDTNGDGAFDNYFHMKAMTIVGNVGGRRNGFVTLNGSANFSGVAARSDENIGIYWRRGLTRRYQEHIEYWYGRVSPRSTARTRQVYGRAALDSGRVTEDGLLFGTGPVNGIDPYRNLELD